ncbi:hypothetical protein [Sporohalobacter salinus]|uniref:hypothetical protein n=1 Tax=Sporohalobacter salinus TaxID=1494606 RepID=UPI0019613D61|nr:hypothetical protein [Sporohalobacter salinus]MBM7624230.1 hypothetical protein [Sporohalobacter salinus]
MGKKLFSIVLALILILLLSSFTFAQQFGDELSDSIVKLDKNFTLELQRLDGETEYEISGDWGRSELIFPVDSLMGKIRYE